MTAFRFAVSVMPREGILDPQGRAVENALPQLDAASVNRVRVGRRIELTVEAGTQSEARAVVDRLSADLLANPLVEDWQVEPAGQAGSAGQPAAVEAGR
jgi:phosphoribosylformylglycinamidine synthase subunit PurS